MRNCVALLLVAVGCEDTNRATRPGLMMFDAGVESEAESEAESESESESEAESEAESESEGETCVPTGDELCDGLDNDCNDATDENTFCALCPGGPYMPYYQDADGDGFGNPAISEIMCSGVGAEGWVDIAGDCDDTSAEAYPGYTNTELWPDYPPQTELCDGLDNDCNGAVDEIFRTGGCYVGDGGCRVYGIMACQPDGTNVCSDAWGVPVVAREPSPEVCLDSVDNDCDGTIDDDCPCITTADCGAAADPAHEPLCVAGEGCIYPLLDDPCDVTEDCGRASCARTRICICPNGIETRWRDDDGDGFGDPNYEATTCVGTPNPYEEVRIAGDCNDADERVHIYADELCDGIDNDCDPETTDGSTFEGGICYTGGDGNDGCEVTTITQCVVGCAPDDPTCCHEEETLVCTGECRNGFIECTEAGMICVDEVEPVAEICGDGLDNDCDGQNDCRDEDCADECTQACTLVTLEDGTVVGANGAPNFLLAASSPTGGAVPSLMATLRFNIYALGECDDIVIDNLNFQITFTDNAESRWRPHNIFLVELSNPSVGIPGFVIAERELGGAILVAVPAHLFVRAGTSLAVELWVDTTGASMSFDDTLVVTVQNPVRWHVNEESAATLTTREETLPLNGSTLTF